jgi:hypothetical protein
LDGMLRPAASAAATGCLIPTLVAVDEILQKERNVALQHIAAPTQLLGDIGGYVLRPVLGGIEGNHADRAFILTGQKVGDDSLQLGRAVVGFPPDPAESAKMVHH